MYAIFTETSDRASDTGLADRATATHPDAPRKMYKRESVQLYNMSECSDAGGNAETLDGSDAPPARIYMPL